jgi:DNA-binding winged helix-turn-helix (wHTH) protein
MEIFEEYFSEYNKAINNENARTSGTDYADLRKSIEEAIETFAVTATLTQVTAASNRFFLPSASTTGSDYFLINKILCYDASVSPRVYKGEAEITFPKKEFKLLVLLASKPGKVFTREYILEQVWGDEVVVGDRTIDVHIRKLREKLGDNYIKTIKGIGYKFDAGRNAFIPPKPYASWILNETTCQWESPIAYPTDGKSYNWNETTQNWDLQQS